MMLSPRWVVSGMRKRGKRGGRSQTHKFHVGLRARSRPVCETPTHNVELQLRDGGMRKERRLEIRVGHHARDEQSRWVFLCRKVDRKEKTFDFVRIGDSRRRWSKMLCLKCLQKVSCVMSANSMLTIRCGADPPISICHGCYALHLNI